MGFEPFFVITNQSRQIILSTIDLLNSSPQIAVNPTCFTCLGKCAFIQRQRFFNFSLTFIHLSQSDGRRDFLEGIGSCQITKLSVTLARILKFFRFQLSFSHFFNHEWVVWKFLRHFLPGRECSGRIEIALLCMSQLPINRRAFCRRRIGSKRFFESGYGDCEFAFMSLKIAQSAPGSRINGSQFGGFCKSLAGFLCITLAFGQQTQ